MEPIDLNLSATQTALLEAAIQAPSADNSCPWQWQWVNEDKLILSNDPALSGKATDNTYILTNLAMGAAAENIVLKAVEKNLSTKVNYRHEQDRIEVTIEFEKLDDTINVSEQKKLASQISLRHSDRRFPFKGQVSGQQLAELEQSIQNSKSNLLGFNEKSAIKAVEPIIRRAEAVRFEDESLHAELFDSVKFDEKESEEGMTLAVLGIEVFARPMFRLLRKWSFMKALNIIGASKLIAIRSVSLPILNSPALVMITTPSDSSEDVFQTGRQIQRVWLKATELGLSVHLYAAPGVLSLAMPDLASQHSEVLRKVKNELDHISQQKGHCIMCMRLGERQGEPAKSGRRSISSLIKKLS